ncbi:MAG TPA: N,N-dimethylformamidase beta subunit family domain-containing protein [Kineosporiaceae bacterium]
MGQRFRAGSRRRGVVLIGIAAAVLTSSASAPPGLGASPTAGATGPGPADRGPALSASTRPDGPGAPGPTGPPGTTVAAARPATVQAASAWQASIARTLPADLPRPVLNGPCSPAVTPGWLAVENRRPGTPLSVADGGLPGSDTVGVTATRSSAGCGDTVGIAVSGPRDEYTVHAWRVGSYGGAGARVTWTSPAFTAAPQPVPPGATTVGAGPGWHPSTEITITVSWLPGLYLLQVRSLHRPGLTGWVPLTVRGPAVAAGRAPAAYVVPTLTWAAYNPYGGASLYRAVTGPVAAAVQRRARVVALARPLVDAGQHQVAEYTVPLVQAVEAAGVDVDYLTDTDVDASPSLLAGRAEVVVGSHAEYATTRLYDTLEAVRNAGTNLAFLGANQLYWHVLLVRGADGTPQGVRLYRVLAEDPARLATPDDVTIRWRDAPLGRPEALLIGAQYRGLGVAGPVLPLDPPAWTGWTGGTPLRAAASGEVDATTPTGPPAVQVLARGTTLRGRDWIDTTATYYAAPSGAGVVDSASIDTGCLARGSCSDLAAPAATRQALAGFVVRVVSAFGTPRFGATHPADAEAGGHLGGAALAARYGAAATGRATRPADD